MHILLLCIQWNLMEFFHPLRLVLLSFSQQITHDRLVYMLHNYWTIIYVVDFTFGCIYLHCEQKCNSLLVCDNVHPLTLLFQQIQLHTYISSNNFHITSFHHLHIHVAMNANALMLVVTIINNLLYVGIAY